MARGQLPRSRPYKGIIFTQTGLPIVDIYYYDMTYTCAACGCPSLFSYTHTLPLGQLADRFEQLPTPNSPKEGLGGEEKSVRKRGVQAFEGEESFENGRTRGKEMVADRGGWDGVFALALRNIGSVVK